MQNYHVSILLVLALASLASPRFMDTSLESTTITTLTPDGGNVIGGDVVEPGSTPWLVSILDAGYDPPTAACSGTIINHFLILTTAFCLLSYDPFQLRVVLGEYDRHIDEGLEIMKVPFFFATHPEFDYYTRANNVGLLFVTPIHFNERIQPARLLPHRDHPKALDTDSLQFDEKHNPGNPCKHASDFKQDLQGEDGLIAGWGRTSTQEFPDLIHAANLTVLPNDGCEEDYKDYDLDTLMCAANITYGGAGGCMGDEGSALINKDGFILGIYNYFEPCIPESNSGLYVNMSMVQDWICEFYDWEHLSV